MTGNSEQISKRDFLQSIGMIGGSVALYTALQGLNKVHATTMAAPPKMATSGNGKKLIILGAGLAGMAAAIEMRKKEQNNEKAIKNSICFVRKNYLNK